jgi:hypothetical protein
VLLWLVGEPRVPGGVYAGVVRVEIGCETVDREIADLEYIAPVAGMVTPARHCTPSAVVPLLAPSMTMVSSWTRMLKKHSVVVDGA